MTVAELETFLAACIRRLDRPKYVPYVFDERAHAIKCEENRCAEVDAYYAREGIKRTPEAILARRVYRDEPAKYKANRKLAYN
jgi:hypothetical protein